MTTDTKCESFGHRAFCGTCLDCGATVPYLCQLCGQRIDDGRPCGCGSMDRARANTLMAHLQQAVASLEALSSSGVPLTHEGKGEVAGTLLPALVEAVGWPALLNTLIGITSSWHRNPQWRTLPESRAALDRLTEGLTRAAVHAYAVDERVKVHERG
jgi:hypothetical protein